MRRPAWFGVAVVCAAVAAGVACARNQAPAATNPAPATGAPGAPPAAAAKPSAPAPAAGAPPAVAAAPAAPGAAAPGAAAPGGGRRRPPPNPVVQDSIRRAVVDSILKTIAGRENQPAGEVFKNVKYLKTMPAREFLKQMDENYGRGLGWTCGACHIAGKFDVDERKNKRIARQMQEMTGQVNEQLAKVKELNEDYEQVTCVMCHKGTNEPKGTMAVPPVPPGAVSPVAAPRPG